MFAGSNEYAIITMAYAKGLKKYIFMQLPFEECLDSSSNHCWFTARTSNQYICNRGNCF